MAAPIIPILVDVAAGIIGSLVVKPLLGKAATAVHDLTAPPALEEVEEDQTIEEAPAEEAEETDN